jgi:hypothetical protein
MMACMRSVVLALAVPLAACSYTSYTPPARMMPLETAIAPAAGAADLQLEGSTEGAFWGFGTNNGAARLREGVTENLAVTGEAGMFSVSGNAAPGTDTNAYQTRVGLHAHDTDRTEGPHLAMTAGLGAGTSSIAGRWVSEDVGVVASGNGAWVVPFVALEGFASQPIDGHPFTYTDTNGDPHPDQLTNTGGFRITAGLELRDGSGADSPVSFIAGIMAGSVAKIDHSDGFAGVGCALHIAL